MTSSVTVTEPARVRRPTRENVFKFLDSQEDIVTETRRRNSQHVAPISNRDNLESSLNDADFDNSSDAFDAYSSYTAPENRITLSWSHLSVSIPVKQKEKSALAKLFSKRSHNEAAANQQQEAKPKVLQKPLLRDVYGVAKPGSILAIIGSSGAGKSTLMNLIMGRTNRQFTVQGKVKANGAVLGRDINKVSAYLQQDDIFHPSLTVGEHMWFHSKLRMSGERYSDKDRHEKIRSVLHELGLTKCFHSQIGGASGDHVGAKTLSGGERKRLAFATEVLTNPSVFFCDEPTTGLDSFMAESIVQSMKHLANRGKTVVCTLHQPSSQIIALLDNVLVLSEGRVVYLGAVPKITEYFTSIGQDCPPSFNPFDHVIGVLSSPLIKFDPPAETLHSHLSRHHRKDHGGGDDDVIPDLAQLTDVQISMLHLNRDSLQKADTLAEIFKHSKYYKTIRDEIKIAHQRPALGAGPTLLQQRIEAGLEPASSWTQYKMNIYRQFITTIRSKSVFVARIFSTLFFATIYSLLFAQQQYTQRGAANLVGLMYQMSTLAVWENLEPYAMSLPKETPIYFREQQAMLYTPFAYFISRMIIEIPQIFGFSFFYVTIIYWSTNMYNDAGHFFLCVLIHSAAGWCASGLGYVVGFAVDHPGISNGVRRGMGPLLSLTAGMYINLASMPPYIAWIRFVSPTFYANELMQINQWNDVSSLQCEDDFNGACFKDGPAVLEFYGFYPGDVVRNVVAIVAFTFFYRIVAFLILLYRTSRNKDNA